jgi:hypothetical protein
MKPIVKRINAGRYQVNIHGHIFDLENTNADFGGTPSWRLYNHQGVEVNWFETKKGALYCFSHYTIERVQALHNQEFCKYA